MNATQKTRNDQEAKLIPEDMSEKRDTKISVEDDPNLPEKKQHNLGRSCSLFPIHMWLYHLYIVLVLLLPVFGTLLILCGNWVNTGYFSLHALLRWPWPKLNVEDPSYQAVVLQLLQVSGSFYFILLISAPTFLLLLLLTILLQLTCWIAGFFFWLFTFYLIYVIRVYTQLLWSEIYFLLKFSSDPSCSCS